MSRIRLILLAILAVAAVSVIASASASAASCEQEATSPHKFALCLGTTPGTLTTGTLTIHVETDPTAATSFILKTSGITVTCTTVAGLGLLDAGQGNVTVLNLLLSFSTPTTKCVVSGVPGCKVAEPIATTLLSGVEDPTAKEKEKLLFLPLGGATFATIKFENNGAEECLVAGSDKVTIGTTNGGVLCTSPIETTRLLQLFTCLKGNSSLEFKKEAATFEGEFNVKLLSAGAATEWRVVEGK